MTEENITILFEHKITCPNCGNEAEVVFAEYSLINETLVIMTMKCQNCGYRKSDIIPITNEGIEKCLEIKISTPEDLNTIIYIPPGSTIEIPELSLRIDIAELSDMSIGSYATVDGILINTIEYLEPVCTQQEDVTSVEECVKILKTLRQAASEASIPITIRVSNSYGDIKVVRTYRNNYSWC